MAAGPWAIGAVGLVSSSGDGMAAVFDALREHSQAELVEPGSESGESIPARWIVDFDPRRYLERKGLKHLSRTSQLACAAAAQLVERLDGYPPEQVGVVLGTAWASLDCVVRFEREAHTEGPRFVDPILFTETVANVPAGQLSIVFGWAALNATVASGTASGLVAVREALRFLEEGRAQIVVAGASDELNRHLLRTLHAEGLTARVPALPLTEEACGPIPGEGACVITVERERDALAQGKPVLARILGAVTGAIDGHGESRGPAIAALMRDLLDQSSCPVEAVDLLLLSANGNNARDRAELAAVEEVFGPSGPPQMLPKARLGECWAASGPTAIGLAIEAMRRGAVPPRPTGFEPAADLTGLALPRQELECRIGHALVLDVAGAEQGAALLLQAPE